MRVLIACEFSGVVTNAFRLKGHEAWSCDILPTDSNPDWHIQGDVLKQLDKNWDMMIAHPPCTYLCNSGVSWLHKDESRWVELEKASEFFKTLLTSVTASKSPGDAIGNPASIISTPSSSNTLAICIFSSKLIDAPGDCSPSRIVVSKMYTLFLSVILLF